MNTNLQLIHEFWPHFLITAFTLLAMMMTAVHVVMLKRDFRAAVGWLGLIWFAPIFGVCLYWLFGINRIQRRAKKFSRERKALGIPSQDFVVSPHQIDTIFGQERSVSALCRLTEKVTMRPLLSGNAIAPLINGDQAYHEMITAIEGATISISLSTYIFANDSLGNKFRVALREAVLRGVDVRVLIDAVGARYSIPSIIGGLKRDGVRVSRFMKTLLPWRFRYLNLRNHRKIMVVDGIIGFTGGINITEFCVTANNKNYTVQDIHFKIQGHVVAELQQVFVEDWLFNAGENLQGPAWFPVSETQGDVIARGISDGPDEDFDKLRFVMMGAIAGARSSIRIATPYFVPDNEMITALQIAALRGVKVQILLPGKTNLRMVKWASDASLVELVRSGCEVLYTAAPFDHSKLMVMDGEWVLLGSANWDARSLLLNFEFNVECYNTKLARTVEGILDTKGVNSTRPTLRELEGRGFFVILRNRFFKLFTPYL
nr:cardiolipin synthase [Desulfobulbaceae bacterium]